MRVIVTGSRDLADDGQVERVLGELLAEHPMLILVHGACPRGADAYADRWARARQAAGANILIDRYPAAWDRIGRAAGMARNADMVNSGADLVVAFYQPGAPNRGTAHCARLAARAGIRVRRYGLETQKTAGQEQETLPL